MRTIEITTVDLSTKDGRLSSIGTEVIFEKLTTND